MGVLKNYNNNNEIKTCTYQSNIEVIKKMLLIICNIEKCL